MTTRAVISASGSGDHTIIAGGGGGGPQTIQVMAIFYRCSAATSLKMKGGSTDLTGAMAFDASGGQDLPNTGSAYFEVTGGADFIMNLSLPLLGMVGGWILYNQF